MPEPPVAATALAAGVCCSAAVLAVGRDMQASLAEAAGALRRLRPAQLLIARRWLELEIERAGWHETPERVVAHGLVAAAGLGALGLSTAAFLGPATGTAMGLAGLVSGIGGMTFALHSSATRRSVRLKRELAPLLELFVLELGGGGSAMSALGSVTLQLEGELAVELRRQLIASQVSGSTTFEARLRDVADRLHLPALSSLATILVASREYGTGVTQGVRALAADLRRQQRRELIAHSRRALNHVLFPTAIGVLLPFLAILLFPAVSALQSNLQ